MAASVGRVWSLVCIEFMSLIVLTRMVVHWPSRIKGLVVVVMLLLASEVARVLARYRCVALTTQRILVFDMGRKSATSVAHLVTETTSESSVTLPTKRWRRFTPLGEPLYFLWSYEFGHADVVGPSPAVSPSPPATSV